MAEIQGKIIKQGKRNMISQHFHAKNDKGKITAWRLGLDRILQVFNVHSTVTARRLLTFDSQTELAINTNVTVTETHVMVSNIHHTIVECRAGNNSRNLMVSDTRSLFTAE